MKHLNLALILTAAAVWPVAAQSTIPWDSSGNSMLSGTYYFRQLAFQGIKSSGSIGQTTLLYGTMTFDGKGNYTVTGQKVDSTISSGTPQSFTFNSGTYGISASGFGYIDNPLFTSESVIGAVAQGVFVGSSTEGSLNDVFVAVPAGSAQAGLSTFNGKYWFGYMNMPGSDPGQFTDAFMPITANGAGGFTGSITATGYAGTSTAAVSQTVSSLSYSFSGGVGTLTFPSSGTLISGAKVMYVSADGNFAIGGSANSYDLFFAIRAPTGTVSNSSYSGLYYTAGVDEDNSTAGAAVLDTFYGAFTASGTGSIYRDDRLAYFDSAAYEFAYDTSYSLDSTGSYSSYYYRYGVGNGGLGFVAVGKGPVLALSFGVKAPTFSGNGVYLNPTGVVNAASYAPFIGGVARGELITLYGSGLAASTVVSPSLPFPTTLGNVQVTINGRKCPIYYVSPTQISVIVPYETELSFAAVQVTNNGTASNTVTVYMNDAAPGVFSQGATGVGYAAALHANYQLVSAANPAKKGETILVFLTGLGDVTPSATAGAAAPSNPLSYTSGAFYVYVDGADATTSYVGLAPGLAGLYQINVAVPSTASAGDLYLDIQADSNGFYTSQVKIPVQ
ncbi:MAG: hypothetical protein JSU00_24870 [Acidobacteria bacterium]|nr:hypothetical protein [Acidobacteriota bacterium]